MSRAKMVAINGEKLRALIQTTGSTLPEASERLGYSKDYIANCVRQNTMTRQAISLIGLMLNILQEHGFDARRTAQYCGNTGEAADVIGLDGFHIEVKRCKTTKIWDWIHQAENDHKAEEIPLVVFRKSREEWQVCLSFNSFLKLLQNR